MAIVIDLQPRRLLLVSLTLQPDPNVTGGGGVAPDEQDLPFDVSDIAFDE